MSNLFAVFGIFGPVMVIAIFVLIIMTAFSPLCIYLILRGMRKELEAYNQQILRLTIQMNDRLGTISAATQTQAGVSKINSNVAMYVLSSDNNAKISANQLRELVQKGKVAPEDYIHDGKEWLPVSSVV